MFHERKKKMSYIPDCRAEYKTNYRGEKTGEPNPYYEGNLNENDKQFIKGFDWCVDTVNTIEFTDFEDIPEEVSVKDAKLVLSAFKEWLLERIECDRDETIVSIIDEYPEEED